MQLPSVTVCMSSNSHTMKWLCTLAPNPDIFAYSCASRVTRGYNVGENQQAIHVSLMILTNCTIIILSTIQLQLFNWHADCLWPLTVLNLEKSAVFPLMKVMHNCALLQQGVTTPINALAQKKYIYPPATPHPQSNTTRHCEVSPFTAHPIPTV